MAAFLDKEFSVKRVGKLFLFLFLLFFIAFSIYALNILKPKIHFKDNRSCGYQTMRQCVCFGKMEEKEVDIPVLNMISKSKEYTCKGVGVSFNGYELVNNIFTITFQMWQGAKQQLNYK